MVKAARKSPDILVIMSDDHAQWAAGCYGNSELRTPAMDWLAAHGARMANAFTTCPVCSPARASFFTGRLLEESERRGWLENALVIYTSDHGHMNGHHGLYFKGNATVPQNLYEEAIRVPCLLCWNGVIKAGKAHPEMVDHCDLFQTVLDAAGASPAGEAAGKIHSPGKSYLPLLRGKALPWRPYAYLEYGNARMISSERSKLVCRYKTRAGEYGDEFYDLERDPRERVNRINEAGCAREIAGLRRDLERHFAEYENPEYSARRVDERPPCNSYEPWRMKSPADDFA